MKFIRDKRAVTALEYGIGAGIMGLILISIFSAWGWTQYSSPPKGSPFKPIANITQCFGLMAYYKDGGGDCPSY